MAHLPAGHALPVANSAARPGASSAGRLDLRSTPAVCSMRAPSLLTLLFVSLIGSPLRGQPNLTATLDDATAATVRKNPGDTVSYTAVVANTGTAAATTVTLTAAAPANTADVGSFNATAVAVDDAYPGTVIANTSINTNSASEFTVLANDYAGVLGGTAVPLASLTITAFDATSTGGGAVTMVTSGADVGKFTYKPAPGYTGTDTFTYTLSNGVSGATAASLKATVSITVGGPVIWFVDPTAVTNGNGTLATPFNNLASALAAIGSNQNHRIFYYSGGAAVSATIVLRSGGWLVGQAANGGSFDAVMGITFPADAPARPAVSNPTKPAFTSSTGHTVTLGEGSVVLGVALSNTAMGGYAVLGLDVNAAQIGGTADVTLSASGTSLGAVSLTNGNGNVNLRAAITCSSGRSLFITGRTGGTVAVSGAVTDTGSGILLDSNTGATISITGGLSLSTGANSAFDVRAGGTVTATQDNDTIVNTLTTTTGTPLSVVNTNIGLSGITFRSISCNGAASGIVLNNTGTTASFGGLTVTGDNEVLNNSSGGTLNAITGSAILLNSTRAVSLDQINIQNSVSDGINGTSVTGFTLTRSIISGAGNAANQHGVTFTNLFGTCAITNCNITNSQTNNVRVSNTTTTAGTLTISGCTLTPVDATNGSHAAYFETGVLSSAGNLTVVLSGSNNLSNARSDAVRGSAGGTSTLRLTVTGTGNNYNGALGSAFGVFASGNATVYALCEGQSNLSTGTTGSNGSHVINIQSSETGAGLAPTVHATIRNNAITSLSNGSQIVNGVRVFQDGRGTMTAKVSGNSIVNVANNGVSAISRNGPGVLNLSIGGPTGSDANIINLNNSTAADGVFVESGSGAPGETNTVKLNLQRNTSSATTQQGYHLRSRTGTTFQLEGFTGNGTLTNDITTWINTTRTNTGSTDVTIGPAFTTVVGLVPQPTLPLLFAEGGNADAPSATGSAGIAPAGEGAAKDARGPEVGALHSILTQSELDRIVAAALARWEATGLSAGQSALLRALVFEVTDDLPGRHLGDAGNGRIRVSRSAAGQAWFIDPQPDSDLAFPLAAAATRRHAGRESAPAGLVDLLSALLHEMGHILGLPDLYEPKDRGDVMFGFLTRGERRLPRPGQAGSAMPPAPARPQPLAAPLVVPTLPAGKSVVVTYSVQIAAAGVFPPSAGSISSQGTVTADGGLSLSTADAVAGSGATVTLVEVPPVVTNVARSTNEETQLNFTAANFTGAFSDANGDALTTVRITSLPANGTLRLNTTAIASVPTDIAIANITQLNFVPAANFAGSTSFGWNGSSGAFAAAAASVNLTVNGINDKPTFTASNPPAVNEDAGPQTIANFAVFSPGGGADESSQTVVAYTVSNVSNPSLFSAPPAVSTSGTLTYTPALNASGTSTFQLRVQDSGGTANGGVNLSDPQTFTITVNAVNDLPVITGQTGAITVAVGSPRTVLTGDLTVTDADHSYPTGFSVQVLPGTGYTQAGASFTATQGGALTVNVTVTDPGSGVSATFGLAVTAQQSPAITSASGVLFTVGSSGTFNVTASGFPAPTFLRGGAALPAGVAFDTDTGVLSGVPGTGTGGPYALTFQATNAAGSSAVQNFTLDINRLPVAGADYLGTQRGIAAVVAQAKLLLNDTDPDGDPRSLTSVAAASAQGGSVAMDATHVTYTPPPGFSGSDSFTYAIADGRGGQASGTVHVTVRPENVPPLSVLSFAPGAGPGGGTLVVCLGYPGVGYLVQRTDNLTAAFTTVSSVVVADLVTGEFQFEDTPGPLPVSRFYRAAEAP